MIYSRLCPLLTSSILCYHMGITWKLFNSQLTFSVRLLCKHVSPRSRFFLWLFSDFLFCLRHPTVIVFCSWQKIILRSQQKMMNDFDWLLFLVFTKIHFLLSTQNNFSFQQKTFLVFITEHISFSPQFVFLVSTKIIFRFQPKSFFGVIQKSFFVVTQNQFWLSPEINFGFHPESFFVVNWN